MANVINGTGRRKRAVARVWLKPGKGDVLINGTSYKKYFDTEENRETAITPLKVAGKEKFFDAKVNIYGGGPVGQAGAVRLGIARALVAGDENLRALMKKNGLLTVDSRVKERKKYGQRGARRKFQFVKR